MLTQVARSKAIVGGQHDGNRRIDTNHPGRVQKIVHHNGQHGHLGGSQDDASRALHKALFVPRDGRLLQAEQAVQTWCPWWRILTIEQRFIQKEYENPRDARHDGAHPEPPAPAHLGHDEGRDQRTEVGTHDDAQFDRVYDARMFVEEKQILDPHESAPLTNAAEESVDYASRQVRREACGRSRPGAGTNHDRLKEQQDGPSPKVTGQGNDKETTCPVGKEVSSYCPLHGRLRELPLTEFRRKRTARDLVSYQACNDDRIGTYDDCGMIVLTPVPPE